MRTHYDVLGVAPDTPDVVIKAAYRALAKEYHPDGTNASPDSAERFIEIQAAYAVLSKPESRSEYDEELREALGDITPAAHDAYDGSGSLPSVPWQTVPQGRLELERICARLALYSEPMAQSFHAAYLRGECGEDPARFAEDMERDFFREYFGEDPDLQALARLFLLGGRTGAAFTLNQLMAGGAEPQVKNPRTVLPMLLDQHFQDETLFAEWLKVKFGITPVDAPQTKDAEVLEVAAAVSPPAAARPARQAKRSQSPSNIRSIALIFMWAIALYFALFAALPLVQ